MSGYLIALISGGGLAVALALVIVLAATQRRRPPLHTSDPELQQAADDLRDQIDQGRRGW